MLNETKLIFGWSVRFADQIMILDLISLNPAFLVRLVKTTS